MDSLSYVAFAYMSHEITIPHLDDEECRNEDAPPHMADEVVRRMLGAPDISDDEVDEGDEKLEGEDKGGPEGDAGIIIK